MADKIIGIEFGVAGGGSISGKSGKIIKQQLNAISKSIVLKVKAEANTTKISKELDALKTKADEISKALSLKVDASKSIESISSKIEAQINTLKTQTEAYQKAVNDNSKAKANASKEQAAKAKNETKELDKLTSLTKKLYRERQKLNGIADRDRGTVPAVQQATDVNKTTDALKAQLKVVNGLDIKNKSITRTLKQSANQALKLDDPSINNAQTANPINVEKLLSKATSLYTDKGFDKILARSAEAQRIVDEFNEKVQESVQTAANGDHIMSKGTLKSLETEFKKTEVQIQKIGIATDSVGAKIRQQFDSQVVQKVAGAFIALATRALTQVYQNVVKINTAMTDLRIVSNATGKQVASAMDNISAAARRVGASIVDLTNSTTVFARLGYDLEQAQILAEKTTVYSNVAGVNVDEATTNITGIIKAFDLGAEGLEDVLDQLIWIGNNFPISQAEIGEAMNNAASALEANGNSLQQAIAIVTAANATIQDVSKSSTATRTIAARISRSEAELQTLGEDIGDVVSRAKLEATLGGFGVQVTEANGELRSTYEILNDIADGWVGFSDVEKNAIADMVAGTRQQSAFFSMMSNWGDAQNIVNDANSAAGSLAEAQEKRLDSIGGKLEQLKATWESVSQNILDSEVVKMGVDFLKWIAEALDNIIKILPTGNMAIMAVTAVALLALKKLVTGTTLFKTALAGADGTTKGFFKSLGNLFKGMPGQIKNLNNLAKTAKTLKVNLADARKAAEDHKGTFSSLNLAEGITQEDVMETYDKHNGNVYAFTSEIKNHYGVTEKAAQATAEWAKEQSNLDTAVKTTDKSLKSASKAQAQMSAAITTGILSVLGILLTIANQMENKAAKLSLTIIAMVGAVVTAIIVGFRTVDTAMKTNLIFAALSVAAGALMAMISAINEMTPSFEDLKEKAKECADAWKATKDELDEINDRLAEVNEEIAKYEAIKAPTLADESELKRLQAEAAQLKENAKLKEINESGQRTAAADAALDALGHSDFLRYVYIDLTHPEAGLLDMVTDEMLASMIQSASDVLDGFEYGMDDRIDQMLELVDRYKDELMVRTNNIGDALDAIFTRSTNEEAVKSLTAFSNRFKNLSEITQSEIENLANTDAGVKELFEYLKDIGAWDGSNFETLAAQIATLRDALVPISALGLTDDIDALSDSFDTLNNALKDIASNGVISIDNLQKFAEYPEMLAKYFDLTADGYKMNSNFAGMSDFDILQDLALNDLEAFSRALEKAQEDFEGLTEADFDYETALKNLATAQDNLNLKEAEWASILREVKIEEETEILEAQQKALEDQLDSYKDLVDIRKELLESYQEEVNYQKELAKRQKTVADLETQLSLARLDTSAAGQARARELESQLSEAQDDLDEYTLEHAIQDITDKLDNEYSEYELLINENIEAITNEIDDIATTLDGILAGVENITNTDNSYTDMIALRDKVKEQQGQSGWVGSEDTNKFLSAVGEGNFTTADKYYNDVKSLSDNFKPTATPDPPVEKTAAQILGEQFNILPESEGRGINADKIGDNGEVTFNGKVYHVENKEKMGNEYLEAAKEAGVDNRRIFEYNGELYGYLNNAIVKLGEIDGWSGFWADVYRDKTGYPDLKTAAKNAGVYHTGGFVGNLSELQSNEEFAKLLKGEFVSTPQQMDDFMKKTLPSMINYSGGGSSIINNAPLISINAGTIDKDTMPDLRYLVDQAVEKVEKNMFSALSRTGYKKK